MKRVAIMQPYFFPYLGYFSLIKHTDEFILFDTVQFIRHGWIERNRILKQPEGWLYVRVPLEPHHRETLIKDIRIDNTKDWRNVILSQIQPYKKNAPHYNQTKQVIEKSLGHEFDDIVSLNKSVLNEVCQYLGITRELPVFSQMGLPIEETKAPDEWALNICKALGEVDEYWNPPGGKEFFDKSKYDKAGIELKFHHVNLQKYDQKRQPFEAGLSIIDVMMFNSPQEINVMMDNYNVA